MPFCIFFSAASVLGSQSRGALIAIAAVGAFFWWKTKAKTVTAIVMLVFAPMAYKLMPQEWHERMATISEYQEDKSAMQRVTAWKYAIAVANAHITGGGFNSWTKTNYIKHGIITAGEKAFVAHSIYFSVLNDGGWLGLFLFLLILYQMWRQLGSVIKLTADDSDRADYNMLARMLQVSVVAFMAGGAFLSLSYFDLAWGLMSITICLSLLANGIYPRKSGPKIAGAARPGNRVPSRR